MVTDKLKNSFVSIVLPAFKGEFLKQAINSILSQTYSNFELIIVNDDSKDDLDGIVASFDDSRIKYYTNEVNIGGKNLIQNWNLCLKYASGEYFVMASDDDIYSSDFLREMILLASKYPKVDLFHCRIKMINFENEVISISSPCSEHESCLDFMNQRVNLRRLQVAPDFLCRTSALRKVGGFVDFPLAWYSDEATWYLLARENGVVCSSQFLFSWRCSGINISSLVTNTSKKIEATFLYRKWIVDFVSKIKTDNEIDFFLKKNLLSGVIVATNSQLVFDLVDSSFKNYLTIIFNKNYFKSISTKVFLRSFFLRTIKFINQ